MVVSLRPIAHRASANQPSKNLPQKENREFQATVADQRATQKLLQAALSILQEFYGKGDAAQALLQRQEPAGPPPPPGFETYKKNAASGGVMGMI